MTQTRPLLPVLSTRIHNGGVLGLGRIRVTVQAPDGHLVGVRWFSERELRWRCAEDGDSAEPSCQHTFSAALHLAEHLLGLKRVPELHPSRPVSRDRARGVAPDPDPAHPERNTA